MKESRTVPKEMKGRMIARLLTMLTKTLMDLVTMMNNRPVWGQMVLQVQLMMLMEMILQL